MSKPDPSDTSRARALLEEAPMPITGITDGFGRPIQHACPMWVFRPWEDQAQANHSQTLNRLRERGGLHVVEAVAILKGERYQSMASGEAYRQFVRLFNAANQHRQQAPALLVRVETLEAALRDYGRHRPSCARNQRFRDDGELTSAGDTCNCGLDAALAAEEVTREG